jgi:hypothetical protein
MTRLLLGVVRLESILRQPDITALVSCKHRQGIKLKQIASATLNATDIASPRSHTVTFSLLDEVDLPGPQTQVIVLESAPNTTDPVVLIRGDDWNATSIGRTSRYSNLNLQPIDRVSNRYVQS